MDDQQQISHDDLPEQTRLRIEKVARLRELGIDPYTPRSHRTHEIAELAPLVAALDGTEGGAGQEVTIVGRLVGRRDMGKNPASPICAMAAAPSNSILRRDTARRGAIRPNFESLIDLSDFLQATGTLMRTQKRRADAGGDASIASSPRR